MRRSYRHTSLSSVLVLALLATALVAVPPRPAGAATATLPGGASISVDITEPVDGRVDAEGNVVLEGTAGVGAGEGPGDTALVYVVDVSGSTLAGGGCGGDINNDGSANTILDCEIAAAIALNDIAKDSGSVVEVGAVVYGQNAAIADVGPATGVQALTGPATDANANGVTDVEEVLRSMRAGGVGVFTNRNVGSGWTNFAAGLSNACNALAAGTASNNVIVFMSDGLANLGSNVTTALPCSRPAVVHTFAVGSGSSCTSNPTGRGSLQIIADLTGGTCTTVTNVEELPDVLPELAITRLTGLSLRINGGEAVDISGSSTPALPADGPVTATFEHVIGGLGPGLHEICITAHGSDAGGQGSVTDCIVVSGNRPPVADAGGNQVVEEGSVVTLDGSGSSDPDGDPLSYQWALVDQVGGPPVVLSSYVSPTPSFVAPDDGRYTFRLTVSDGREADFDEVTVTVTNVAPQVSATASPGFATGVSLVTATFTDPGWLDVHTATVDFGDGSAPVDAPVTAGAGWGTLFASHVYAQPGSYTATVTVTDKDGGVGTDTVASVEVGEPVALWANSTTLPRSLDWSGGDGSVEGRVHTNNELRVRGATKQVTGNTTYAGSISADTDRHIFVPLPVLDAVQDYPVTFDIADYRPGGRAAVEAGQRYVDRSGECTSNGMWHGPNTVLEPGLYYVSCNAKLNGSDFGGAVTVVAEGTVEITGSRPAFEAFVDGLLFMAGSSDTKAVKIPASSSKFLGYVFAEHGGVEISGNDNRFFCGILADSIDISGSRFEARAGDCTRPEQTVAASLLVPDLGFSLHGDREDTLPGEAVDYTLEVSNTGARLVLPGVVGAQNVDEAQATLAHWSYQLEYLSVAEQQWVPLAAASGTADGYQPLDPPEAGDALEFVSAPNAAAGVAYPEGDDPLAGTTIAPGSLASWGYQAIAEVTPAQVALLLDPDQAAAVRNVVRFEFLPASAQVRRLFRFGHDLAGELRAQSGDLLDAEITLVPPVGDPSILTAPAVPALTAVPPGATATATAGYTAPVPEPRGEAEPSGAYRDRLAALDGSALRTFAYARASSGVGALLAPTVTHAITQRLPVLSLQTAAPQDAPAGSTLAYDLGLRNLGSAPATALALTHRVAGDEVAASGTPAGLAPAELATAHASYPVPLDHPGGPVAAESRLVWGDTAGNAYGPVTSDAVTEVATAGQLVASQSATVVVDADGSGLPSPGDTLRYTATITNRGATAVTGVQFVATPDEHTALVTGSVTATTGVVTAGNSDGDSAVVVAAGTVAGDSSVTITYDVVVATDFPEDVRSVSVQGTVTGDGLDPVVTDDPSVPGEADPTVTFIIVPVPLLDATMTDTLVVDVDGDGMAGPGDTLGYEVFLHSQGSANLTNTTVEIRLDPNTTLVPGSVTTSHSTIIIGEEPEEPTVTVELGTLPGLSTATVTLRARIADPLPSGVTSVAAQGVVLTNELDPVPTRDPRTTDPHGSTTTTVGQAVPPPLPSPTVTELSLVDGGVVTAPVEISAEIVPPEDEQIEGWRVYYRRAGSDTEVVFATGTGAPPDGVFAVFDPTVVPNGTYVVVVEATASGGGITRASTGLVVDGALKPGRYVLTYEDLTVAVGGLPVALRRTYDSFDKVAGDFGIGWSLELSSVRASTSRRLGDGGWTQRVHSCALVFCLVDYETSVPHAVTVTWPDGRQEVFDLTPATGSNIFPFMTTARFTGRPGTTSRLEPLAGEASLTFLNDGNLYGGLFGTGVYDPRRFRLVARDGTAYVLDRDAGLLSVTDPLGETILVGHNGITSSTGAALLFTRDAAGRITLVEGPGGATVAYGYDAVTGDLVSVTDAEGRTTEYRYAPGSFLDEIIDPLGQPFRTLEYDEAGRLVAITDATGARTIVEIDLDGRQEIVTDAAGRLTTVVTMDERGNVVRLDDISDGETRTTEFAYDDLDNRTLRRDPLGNEWRGVYSGRDLVWFIDPEDAVTNLTYDDGGRLASWRDAGGHETTYEYNADGTLAAIVDPFGHAETYTYSGGNRSGRTDREGNTWQYAYDSQRRLISETDPLGNITSWTYDARGRVASMIDALGGETTYTYDGVDHLVARTDPAGNTTSMAYDAADHLTSRTDPEGGVTSWAYDAAGRVVARTDPTGGVTSYVYDRNGRVTERTDQAGAVTTYAYDGAGRAALKRDPLGRETGYAYDAEDRLTEVVNAAGGVTSYAYDGAGRVVEQQDPTGGTTTYSYSPRGDLLAVSDALGRTATNTYDAVGRLVQIAWPDGTTTSTAYDRDGRVAATTDQAGGVTTVGYDAAGRATSETDPLGRTFTTSYDALGRPVATSDPLGNVTTHAYDPAGRLLSITTPEGVTTSTSYDGRGLPVSSTDGAGNTSTTAYDAAGRAVAETDGLGRTATYAYDPAGRLTALTDALGGSVTFAYDAAGQRTALTDANGETWTTTYSALGAPAVTTDPLGRTTTLAYDAAGRLVSETDGRGVTVTRTYDAASQLLALEHPGGSVAYTYDAHGRRTSMVDDTGTTTWTHDPRGLVTAISGPQGTISYGYDAAGQRTTMTQPEGEVSYSYDAAGRLAHVTDLGGGAIAFTRDGDGRLTGIERPGGIMTTRTYDAAGRMVGVEHSGGGVSESYSYTLDAAGNRVAVTSSEGTESYTLDAVNRLVAVSHPDGSQQQYTYDAAGNRLSASDGTATTSYSYDAAGQLVAAGAESYSYDGAGNRVTAGTDTFAWDWAGRLTSAVVDGVEAAYIYDGDGVRVASVVDGTARAYLHDRTGGLPSIVSDGESGYVHAAGGVLSATSGAGTSYALADALGSVRAVAGPGGTVTSTASYEAFGAVRDSSGPAFPFGFTGEPQDATGLVHLRARDLDPSTGTFLSTDPVRPGAPGVTGFNLYSYVGNNPTTWTDPTGAAAAVEYSQLLRYALLATAVVLLWWLFTFQPPVVAPPRIRPRPAPAPPQVDPVPRPAPAPNGRPPRPDPRPDPPERPGPPYFPPWPDSQQPQPRDDQDDDDDADDDDDEDWVTVYRVYGHDAPKWGGSWTPVDPRTYGPNLYRHAAGLPDKKNSGEWLIIGEVQRKNIDRVRPAKEINDPDAAHGHYKGGMPEYVIFPSRSRVRQTQPVIRLIPPYGGPIP